MESDVVTPNPASRSFDSLPTFTQGVTNDQTGVGTQNAVVNPISEAYYSSLRTRSVVEPDYIYTEWPKIKGVDPSLKMTYSPLLKKPFFVRNIKWLTTETAGTTISFIDIPGDLLSSNEIVDYPFKLGSYYRAKISLILQVAGTPSHAGVALVGALPGGMFVENHSYLIAQRFNSLLCAPHAFLHANESTAVRLQIPFYSNTALLPCKPEENGRLTTLEHSGNYSRVYLLVMNALTPGSNAATEVTISVHAVFDEIEIYVPNTSGKKWIAPTFEAEGSTLIQNGKRFVSDFIDNTTQVVKSYVGLHNPNKGDQSKEKQIISFRQTPNSVQNTTTYEKMDPYTDFDRITNDFIFGTKQDEMDLKYLLSKPCYIGTFSVSTSLTTGKLLFARPITPMQIKPSVETALSPYQGEETTYYPISSILQILYWMSKYWRGSLNLHIQSSMSNFQFAKLQVVRDYAPSYNVLTKVPDSTPLQSMMVETLEFSGGGQVQTVKLPFASMFNKLPCTNDPITNCLSHGMYYIYLATPLVSSLTSANSVSFNVYLSAGDDFQYFGYAIDPLTMFGHRPTPSSFVAEASVMQPITSQVALTTPGHSSIDEQDEDHQPITSLRDYLRRSYRTIHLDYTADKLRENDGLIVFDVYQLMSEWFPPDTTSNWHREYSSPRGIIKSMFLGLQGGVRIKAIVQGASVAQMWYVPPGMSIRREADTALTADYMGTVPFPSNNFPKGLQCVRASVNIFNEDGVLPYNWSSVAPIIERPNYFNTATGQSVTYAENGKVTSAASCILEGHIPNVSPLNFVGDPRSLMGWTKESSNTSRKLTTNMGHIIISVGRPCFYNANISNEASDINLSIYVSLDDQARLGFQVAAPAVAPPTVKEGDVPHIITVSNQYDSTPYQANYFTSAYYG